MLPPIDNLFINKDNLLPAIKVNDEPEGEEYDHKLKVLEPYIESPLSPNLSSPSSVTSSVPNSPVFLPISDPSHSTSPFLLSPMQEHFYMREQTPPLTENLFGPKRKRGRPASTTQPRRDNQFTFIQPTVWDVNHQLQYKNSSGTPKKKRGRKPKQQFSGNSCFVWKDLTAPRSPNKRSK